MLKKTLIIITILILLAPQISQALTFDHNYIITDNDLTNANSMSVGSIQKFLANRGALGTYTTTDLEGNTKTAAQTLHEVGQAWSINPQYLIVRAQIEQSLITASSPTQRQLDWATGYGVCDSCSTDDPSIQKYKGFYNQIYWAARKIRESYLTDLINTGTTFTGWGPGITKTVTDYNGTYTVTPANNATAALYTYTPHVYNANYNIWLYWNQWFNKNYPDGSLVQVQGEGGIYLIQDGKKRPFLSRSAFFSRFKANRIILVSKYDLDAYETGLPIKYSNYSLLQSEKNGRIFLIDGDDRRYIESPDIFRKIGFNPEEIIKVPESDLAAYNWGANINMQSIHPTGVLLQSKETGGITYVENGIKHSIWSREILQNRYANKVPVIVEQSTIDEYAKGDPVKFEDGTLVTSPNANGVFVISKGQRRGIASKEVFDTIGFRWDSIIHTSDDALNIHPLGEPIDFN